jgi:hypothetical protein
MRQTTQLQEVRLFPQIVFIALVEKILNIFPSLGSNKGNRFELCATASDRILKSVEIFGSRNGNDSRVREVERL